MPPHIKSPDDLVTSPEEVCAGFLEQAKAKADEAKPYVKEALAFLDHLKTLEKPEEIANLYDHPEYREALLAAAGYSNKSLGNLSKLFSKDDMTELLRAFFATDDFQGEDWRQQVFTRYLLTRGDSLGGTMRNVIGASGKKRFVVALIEALKRKGVEYELKEYKSKVRGIEWKTGRNVKVKNEGVHETEVEETRMCVFDTTPSQLGLAIGEEIVEEAEENNGAEASEEKQEDKKKNNVDVIVLDSTLVPETRKRRKGIESKSSFDDRRKKLFKRAETFLACGELKSGIDPAGADEHFKTAGSAMGRLRSRFQEHGIKLSLFIVAAAVAKAMAAEIFADLESGAISHAANFTNSEQLSDLTDWIVNL